MRRFVKLTFIILSIIFNAAVPSRAGVTEKLSFKVSESSLGKRPPVLSHPRPIFSPDNNRIIYVARRGNDQTVLVQNGREIKNSEGAQPNTVRFSPNSKRLAYAIKQAGKAYFFSDRAKSGPYDEASRPLFSPDSKHLLYVARRGGKSFVVMDGTEGKEYDVIDHLAFSPDGRRSSYTAYSGGKAYMVVDRQETGPYDTLSAPVFSPDSKHLAYACKREGKEFVVRDGLEEKQYSKVGDVVFSPDSNHLAYAAMEGKWRVVVDGVEGEEQDTIAIPSIRFSPDGKRLAYVVIHEDKMAAIVDGREGKSYRAVSNFIFSPDGKRFAYAASSNGRGIVVTDTGESKEYDDILPLFLHFSPDSKRLLFVAKSGEKHKVVVDGVEGSEYINITDPVFSPQGDYVAYTAQRRDFAQVLVINNIEAQKYDTFLNTGSVKFNKNDRLELMAVRGADVYKVVVQINKS